MFKGLKKFIEGWLARVLAKERIVPASFYRRLDEQPSVPALYHQGIGKRPIDPALYDQGMGERPIGPALSSRGAYGSGRIQQPIRCETNKEYRKSLKCLSGQVVRPRQVVPCQDLSFPLALPM